MGEKTAQDGLSVIRYRNEPTILLFGDSDGALERARRSAHLAGCRVAGADRIDSALGRLDRQIAADAILLEIDGESEALPSLLDGLESAARAGRCRSVVCAPEALIDLVAARVPHPDIIHLCRPSEADRAVALSRATAPRLAMLHDIGRGEGAALLQQLSEEAGRIASILASLSGEDGAPPGESAAPPEEMGTDEPAVEAGYVRSIIRARRLRDQYFHGGLFADPAWDMLLDLMAARLEGNRVAVSSLCIAAAVPATTALRWIKTLTDEGLLVRAADPQDGRRVYIELSDETARALTAYLKAVQRIAPVSI